MKERGGGWRAAVREGANGGTAGLESAQLCRAEIAAAASGISRGYGNCYGKTLFRAFYGNFTGILREFSDDFGHTAIDGAGIMASPISALLMQMVSRTVCDFET